MLVSLAIALFFGSFALAAALTAAAKRIAPRMGLVAHPRADRYHRSVIPLGGGAAIFGTLALFLLTGAAVMRFLIVPGYLTSLVRSAGLNPADFLHHGGE